MKRAQWEWAKFSALVLVTVAVVLTLRCLGVDWSKLTPQQIRTAIQACGWWSPIVYILVFSQPIIPLPGSIMAMAGGLLFGLGGGFLTVWIAAIFRACGQFGLARLCGREAIQSLLRGRMAAWDKRIGHDGFRTVLWIRLLPNVPLDIQNFGLGCSRVPFRPFLAATALGMIPGLAVWVYLGYTLSDYSQLWKIGVALLGVAGLWALQHHYRTRRIRVSSS